MVSVDILAPQKSHIDLSNKTLPSDFGLDDYELSELLDDVILVEYCDLVAGEDNAEYIKRGSIVIPISQITNAWRKGVVILAGPRVQQAKVGDIVVFPSSMGIPVMNLEVSNHGKVKNGLFLNEQRIFGICKKYEKNPEDRA